METIPLQEIITDDTILDIEGRKLKYWQLRSDVQQYLENNQDFLQDPEYSDRLPDAISRFLIRKRFFKRDERIVGQKKAVWEKLCEEFSSPNQLLKKFPMESLSATPPSRARQKRLF